MRYLSLFSGIEGASVAWHPLGWECAGVSEIEPFPCAVIAHHYPTIPNLGDVTKITEEDIAALGRIDLVVFGSPCQDLSVAGLRKGFICESTDTLTRSGLFFVAMRIVAWARKHNGCRFALWENVPGSFSSSQGRDFAAVVGAMAGLEDVPVPPRGWGNEGVAVGSEGLVEWATLDAQWFGVAQRRRRVFALADFGNWSNRPPILLEPESLRRDTPPRREAGEEVTPTIRAGAPNGGAGHGARSGDSKDELIVPVAHSLRGEGFDASEDGTGRGTPLVPVTVGTLAANTGPNGHEGAADGVTTNISHANGWGIQENVTHTLDQAMGVAVAQPIGFNARQEPDSWVDRTGPLDTDGSTQAIAFSSKDYGNDATADLSPTLRSLGAYNANGGGNMAVALPINTQIATRHEALGEGTGFGIGNETDPAFTLTKGHSHAAAVSLRGREGGATAEQPVGIFQDSEFGVAQYDSAGTLRAGRIPEHQMVMQPVVPTNQMAVAVSLRGREGGATAELGDEVGNCLRASSGGGDKAHVLAAMSVRRLTPVECERLQGFPDNYSQIPWRKKPASECPDGPRYKALGNSWAVPVVQWIGRRIHNATRRSK